MTSKTKSKGLSAGAMLALGMVGALLVSGTPAEAHKKQSSHQGNPKTPQNPGPIGPLPKPPAEGPVIGGWHATKQPDAVRDHRTPAPNVRDHRANDGTVTVTDSKTQARGGTQCLGNMCGVGKSVKAAAGSTGKTVKGTVIKVIPH
jgi:hypothetical protein